MADGIACWHHTDRDAVRVGTVIYIASPTAIRTHQGQPLGTAYGPQHEVRRFAT